MKSLGSDVTDRYSLHLFTPVSVQTGAIKYFYFARAAYDRNSSPYESLIYGNFPASLYCFLWQS